MCFIAFIATPLLKKGLHCLVGFLMGHFLLFLIGFLVFLYRLLLFTHMGSEYGIPEQILFLQFSADLSTLVFATAVLIVNLLMTIFFWFLYMDKR